jgi:hypothetical protein
VSNSAPKPVTAPAPKPAVVTTEDAPVAAAPAPATHAISASIERVSPASTSAAVSTPTKTLYAAAAAKIALPPAVPPAATAPGRIPLSKQPQLFLGTFVHLSPAQGAGSAAGAPSLGSPGPPAVPFGQALATGASSAPAPGFGSVLTVATLISLLLLVAPRVGRRLRLDAALARPPTLVSLLERPG